jgi:hypothetical protein
MFTHTYSVGLLWINKQMHIKCLGILAIHLVYSW